jgi:4-aminobutyrate aminotransferase-like enzyme/Ser/Thr protein kinase RdoA (MazF antagonist)
MLFGSLSSAIIPPVPFNPTANPVLEITIMLDSSQPLTPADFRFTPPTLADEELAAIARQHFGLEGEGKPLVGERDQNTCITTDAGEQFVLKVSSSDEDPGSVDFQIKALLHLAEVDDSLPVPRVKLSLDGKTSVTIQASNGQSHIVRVLSYLPGNTYKQVAPLDLQGLRKVGVLEARVNKGLCGFFHPHADHFMPWDITSGTLENQSLHDTNKAYFDSHIKPVLNRWQAIQGRLLKQLPAQVIHYDGHSDNLLWSLDGSKEPAGLIDFGDLIYGPAIMDLAIAFSSFLTEQMELCDETDWINNAVALIQGFNSVRPLQEEEIAVLLDMTLARLALGILLFDFRCQHSDDQALIQTINSWRDSYLKTIEVLLAADSNRVLNRFRTACGFPARYDDSQYDELLERRDKVLSSSYSHFFDRPLHIVRGEGVWLWDAAGRKYLDCYNNVPSVGHCHPYVVNALTAQIRTLNTHTRYLHETVIELSERLVELMPPGLDRVIVVCTGTEANDLAAQMARTYTGNNGLLVTESSYHGNSELVTQLSRGDHAGETPPDYIGVFEPPNTYRGPYLGNDTAQQYAGLLDHEITKLQQAEQGVAACMIDSSFDANGILIPPPGYCTGVDDKIHSAGGLMIYDEVQSGYCRMGDHFWGFMDYDASPDIVTMGKPMGAGHPVAAVVTTSEIADRFAERYSYFNTFGGNPVAASAALAVLDVIRDENLLDNVHQVGKYLAEGLRDIESRYEFVGHLQGKGLFWGLDLVSDPESKHPDQTLAHQASMKMRDRGALVGSTGRYGNVLKIRPPLIFSRDNATQLLSTLDEVFSSL